MRKLMIVAAMLAVLVVVAAPAFANHQVSGAASAGGATLRAGDLANQAVQVANNVNTGNVSQDATAFNVQSNIGAVATLTQDITAGDEAIVLAEGILVADQDVDQNVDQNAENTITQEGIVQENNAQLTVAQAIAQVKK